MLSFIENNCRFCTKVFCCKKCRRKHELQIHEIYPDCDICAYGKMILNTPSDDLLNHIKNKHWPLHCIDCNRIFGAVHELILHNKCPLAKPDKKIATTSLTPKIALENEKENVYESPPITSTFKDTTPSSNELLFNNPKLVHLTTSTPRTYNDESLKMFGTITPNDTENKAEDTNTPADDLKSQQSNSKRRVTFSETPIYDSFKKTPQENNLLKSSLKKSARTKMLGKSGSNTEENTKDLDFHKQSETPKSYATLWESASLETPNANSPSLMYGTCESKLEAHMTIEDISESNIAVLGEIQKILKKPQNVNIWTSMTCLVKTIVSGLSGSTSSDHIDRKENATPQRSFKRARVDDVSEEFLRFKKMKLTDIQCRKPINDTVPYRFYIRRQRPAYSDKATQTD